MIIDVVSWKDDFYYVAMYNVLGMKDEKAADTGLLWCKNEASINIVCQKRENCLKLIHCQAIIATPQD